MKKIFKIIIFIAVIAAAAGAVVYSSTRPLAVEVVVAQPQEVEFTFSEDGVVVSAEDYKVYSNVKGKVVEVFADKGTVVKKGDRIARIDPKEYETAISRHENNIAGYRAKIGEIVRNEQNTKDTYSASLSELKARLEQVKAEAKMGDVTTANVSLTLPQEQLKAIEITLEQEEKNLAHQEQLVKDYQILYQAGAISKSELENNQLALGTIQNKISQLETEKAAIEGELQKLKQKYGEATDITSLQSQSKQEQTEATIRQIEAQIEAASGNLSKDYKSDSIAYYQTLINLEQISISTLEDNIQECEIIAAQDGYITEIPVKTLTDVSVQDHLCTIKSETGIRVESYVSTTDVTSLKPGSTVTLVHKGREQDFSYKGVIKEISSWAEEKVSTLGIVQQKVKVIIEPTEELTTAGSGYGMSVVYTSYRAENVIPLPNTALFKSGTEDSVFTVIDGKAVITPITKGSSSNTQTVALEGITNGEIVIKNASNKALAEGMKVTY